MITNYQSFLNNVDFSSVDEGVKPSLELNKFKDLFGSKIFESESPMLVEKAYACYQFGSLYEHRKSWFEDETPIYSLNSGYDTILFKNNEIFIVSKKSMKHLKEGFIDSVSQGWNNVKNVAKSSVDAVSKEAGSKWEEISDGAKKVYEFSARILSAVGQFAKEEPLEAIAIVLQILSGIVAFIPAAGQIIGPVLLGIAGSLEVYGGVSKMKESWEKLKDLDITKLERAKQSVAEGAPLVIAGGISIALGLTDVIGATKAAVPGAGSASVVAKKAAETWEKNFVGSFAHNTEHFIVHSCKGLAERIGEELAESVELFMGKGGSALAATLVTILMVKVGKGVLGGLFDAMIKGLANIAGLFTYILGLPTKLSEALKKVKDSVTTPIAKLLLGGIANFIEPAVSTVGKFLDKYIKPVSSNCQKYFVEVSKKSAEIEKADDSKESSEAVVKEPVSKIKPRNADVSKGDLEKVGSLPKLKIQENLLSFKDFILV